MTNEEQKLREEFVASFTLKYNIEALYNFADWWLNKRAESREKLIESISEDITNYDEVYISEDVRKAINRMKFNLKSIIKNKE